jgi:hypothetical protein
MGASAGARVSPPGSSPPRIGYSTLRNDTSGPGDRRRFCHYAARRGIAFEFARPEDRYDVVISNVTGDLSVWSRLPRSTRFVLDMVDSYLSVPRTDLRGQLRGVLKFAFGHTRRLHLDFRALIEASCRRADAVVCASEEQRQAVLPFCPNVHVILDFQDEVVRSIKSDYARGDVFNLVWEGLAINLVSMRGFASAFRQLASRHPLKLHLLTDLEYAMGSTNIGMKPTTKLVRRLFGDAPVVVYQWNEEIFSAICTACDLAVIPIPADSPYYVAKPESKLILFWRMGLPVVTSDTPSYARAMKEAGLAWTCRGEADWIATLERLMGDEAARRDAGERGRVYADRAYGEAVLLEKWDRVFESLGGEGPRGAEDASIPAAPRRSPDIGAL